MKKQTILFTLLLTFILGVSAFGQTKERVSPSLKNPQARELIKRAIELENAQMFESAIDAYKEVLKLAPKDFAAMTTIAGIYGRLGNAKQEIIWAKKAVEINPKFMNAYINYGNGLALQQKFDEAVKAYKKAEKLAPKNPLPVYSLGVIAENQEKLKEALSLYKKSIELDPKFENGLFNAAAMYANLKQYDEAIVLLKKLLDLNPQAEDAKQMLQTIERDQAKAKKP